MIPFAATAAAMAAARILNDPDNPKIAPYSWDFVTLPEED